MVSHSALPLPPILPPLHQLLPPLQSPLTSKLYTCALYLCHGKKGSAHKKHKFLDLLSSMSLELTDLLIVLALEDTDPVLDAGTILEGVLEGPACEKWEELE